MLNTCFFTFTNTQELKSTEWYRNFSRYTMVAPTGVASSLTYSHRLRAGANRRLRRSHSMRLRAGYEMKATYILSDRATGTRYEQEQSFDQNCYFYLKNISSSPAHNISAIWLLTVPRARIIIVGSSYRSANWPVLKKLDKFWVKKLIKMTLLYSVS